MDEELCFVLNGVPVYLEKVLVTFNDVPIFFICKDTQNHHYVAILVSNDLSSYYVTMPSDEKIYEMLVGKTPMRDIYVYAEWYWMVFSKDKPQNDSVWYISGNSINKAVLPQLNAVYKPVTEEDKKYIQNFKKEFLK